MIFPNVQHDFCMFTLIFCQNHLGIILACFFHFWLSVPFTVRMTTVREIKRELIISVTVTAKVTEEGARKPRKHIRQTAWQKRMKSFEKYVNTCIFYRDQKTKMCINCRWNRTMRRKARKICKSQWMFWLIVILVFLNTCVLATEYHNQPQWLDDFQVTYRHKIEVVEMWT